MTALSADEAVPAPAPGAAARSLLPLVGDTPVVRVEAPLPVAHGGFWAKLECLSLGGMKARAAMAMLQGARARGELVAGAPVVESTSGTLGLGLAFAGQALGHPVVLVIDDELEPAMRTLLRAYGARLEVVERPDPRGGWQQARRERLCQLRTQLPAAFWPDQYHNPDNPAGYVSLARELTHQLDHVDVLVCSVGTGGHSAGIVRELRRRWPRVRLVGVDAVGSTVFGQPARPRLARGLGSSIHPRNVAYPEFAEVHWVGAAEAAESCRTLARSTFVTGGWSTGAVARVASWVARVEPGTQVVAVFPDGPYRYLESIFDDEYCRRRGLFRATARCPVEIGDPTAVEVSRWARCRRVVDPLSLSGPVCHRHEATSGAQA